MYQFEPLDIKKFLHLLLCIRSFVLELLLVPGKIDNVYHQEEKRKSLPQVFRHFFPFFCQKWKEPFFLFFSDMAESVLLKFKQLLLPSFEAMQFLKRGLIRDPIERVKQNIHKE